jgi:hypothetical protein
VRHLLRTIGGDLIEPIDQFGIASTFLDYMLHPIATSAAASMASVTPVSQSSRKLHSRAGQDQPKNFLNKKSNFASNFCGL